MPITKNPARPPQTVHEMMGGKMPSDMPNKMPSTKHGKTGGRKGK